MELLQVKQVVAATAVHALYAATGIICQASFAKGMNNLVLVTYKQVVAAIVFVPFAYFIERNQRPKMTASIVAKIILVALPASLSQILMFYGLSYTGSTFTSAIMNLLPAFTFVISLLLRLESVNLRTFSGNAKVVGTLGCVVGAVIMTLYNGPGNGSLKNSLYGDVKTENFILGALSLFVSTIFLASMVTFQPYIIKEYPALLSLTAMQCVIGAIESGIMCFVSEGSSVELWALDWNSELVTYIFSGVMGTAVPLFLANWAVKQRGPIFLVVFSPLSLIISAVLECSIFHYTLRLGSLIGGGVILTGLYLVLLGLAQPQELVIVQLEEGDRAGNDKKQPLLTRKPMKPLV